MDLELAGKVAVVTGASKGIGLATVRVLALEGAQVVAGARSIDALRGIDGGGWRRSIGTDGSTSSSTTSAACGSESTASCRRAMLTSTPRCN